MKFLLWIMPLHLLVILACTPPVPENTAAAESLESTSPSMADHSLGINNSIHLDETIRNAWVGAKIQVEEIATAQTWQFEVALGETLALNDTGLVLEAKVFIPDFTMDEGGITSTSPEPSNPALQVVIRDASGETYEGWLFVAMPEIHPYENSNFSVILLEGIAAEQ